MKKILTLFIVMLLMGLDASFLFPEVNGSRILLSEDLNFDGSKEEIEISFSGEDEYDLHEYIIKVDDLVYKGKFEYEGVASAEIIDIDRSDKQKEILVRLDGQTDDVIDYFFSLDGSIIKIGEVPGSSYSEMPGDGTVIMNEWMGFWSRDKKYRLEKSVLVPIREEYKIDVNSRLAETMVLHSSPSNGSGISAELKPDTEIKLTAVKIFGDECTTADGYKHECEWYMVESADGMRGWVEYGELIKSTMDLPWAG